MSLRQLLQAPRCCRLPAADGQCALKTRAWRRHQAALSRHRRPRITITTLDTNESKAKGRFVTCSSGLLSYDHAMARMPALHGSDQVPRRDLKSFLAQMACFHPQIANASIVDHHHLSRPNYDTFWPAEAVEMAVVRQARHRLQW